MRTPSNTIGGRVDVAGVVVSGGGFTARKTATGIYAVALPPSLRLISATTQSTGTAISAVPQNFTGSGFGVITINSAGSAVDGAGFSFTAVVA